jgi:hypothetical protein
MTAFLARPAGALSLALLCLAALPCGGGAQEHRGTTIFRTTHDGDDGRFFELRASGDVETSEGDDDVVGLEEDGSLRIVERKDGRERRMEWRRSGDRIVRTYAVDGRSRTVDAAGQAWAGEALRRAVRQQGLGAARRVARLRARGGVPAVLRGVEELEGDGARRIHYRLLLEGAGLRADDAERVVRHAARTLSSSGELRLTLESARSAPLTARGRAALMEAAASISSDGEKALLLRRLATPESLGEREARAAFFRAAASVRSDGELAALLRHVLRAQPTEPVALEVLRTALAIGSDGEKGALLRAVPASLLAGARVREAYRANLATMRSDGERDAARRHLERSAR